MTYAETIQELQKKGLETLKQAQEAHVAALGSVREIANHIATLPVPTPENVPSFATITELGSTFATQLLEQQKAYANQLASFFQTAQKDAAEATSRFIKTTVN